MIKTDNHYSYKQHVISIATQLVNLQNHPAFREEKVSHQQSWKTNTSQNEITYCFEKHCCTQNSMHTSIFWSWARFPSFTYRFLTWPWSDVASTVTDKDDTSRIRCLTVYSIRAFIATAVSCNMSTPNTNLSQNSAKHFLDWMHSQDWMKCSEFLTKESVWTAIGDSAFSELRQIITGSTNRCNW